MEKNVKLVSTNELSEVEVIKALFLLDSDLAEYLLNVDKYKSGQLGIITYVNDLPISIKWRVSTKSSDLVQQYANGKLVPIIKVVDNDFINKDKDNFPTLEEFLRACRGYLNGVECIIYDYNLNEGEENYIEFLDKGTDNSFVFKLEDVKFELSEKLFQGGCSGIFSEINACLYTYENSLIVPLYKVLGHYLPNEGGNRDLYQVFINFALDGVDNVNDFNELYKEATEEEAFDFVLFRCFDRSIALLLQDSLKDQKDEFLKNYLTFHNMSIRGIGKSVVNDKYYILR